MVRLFINYFNNSNPHRQQEYLECLSKNLSNPHLNEIILLLENKIQDKILNNEKIKKEYTNKRPTFSNFFKVINKYATKDDISIISNSDMYFDETIKEIKRMDLRDKVLCLSRWDVDAKGNVKLFNRDDSQDVWIFKSKVVRGVVAEFCLGIPGCDNKIAYELDKVGYSVYNPSKLVKCYHLHLINIRTYKRPGLAPPFKMIQPDYGNLLLKN